MIDTNLNEFSITKTTMRELTHSETEIVGGGSSYPCIIRAAARLIRLTMIPDDGIFDDGFDQQP